MKIYVDGSCSLKTGNGAWAALIDDNDEVDILWGHEAGSTNQRLELLPAIEALRFIKEFRDPDQQIVVFTDSKYLEIGMSVWVHNWSRKGWTRADGNVVKNLDLWLKLYEEAQGLNIHWRWVKGHSGNLGNEIVDKLASYMRRENIRIGNSHEWKS